MLNILLIPVIISLQLEEIFAVLLLNKFFQSKNILFFLFSILCCQYYY